MLVVAMLVKDSAPFSPDRAVSLWRSVHGVSLLLGTVTVSLGFAAGVMYLIQSNRLKRKLPKPRIGIRLPSLEWLQRLNREALWFSTLLLGVGLFSGVVLNMETNEQGGTAVAWTDAAVLSSAGLFVWLLATACFELLYKPARVGRKVAYLTTASFVFLALVLVAVFSGRHASTASSESIPSATACCFHRCEVALREDLS